MRVLRAAAMFLLLLAGPALAQAMKPPAPPADPPKSPSQIEADKVTDSAYKRSLGNIPDKPPADPWGSARATDEPKPAAPSAKRTKAGTGSTTN
jgi:hypothetical protein